MDRNIGRRGLFALAGVALAEVALHRTSETASARRRKRKPGVVPGRAFEPVVEPDAEPVVYPDRPVEEPVVYPEYPVDDLYVYPDRPVEPPVEEPPFVNPGPACRTCGCNLRGEGCDGQCGIDGVCINYTCFVEGDYAPACVTVEDCRPGTVCRCNQCVPAPCRGDFECPGSNRPGYESGGTCAGELCFN